MIKKLFDKRYYNWENVSLITGRGRYYLLQVRYHRKTNKAQFKQRCLGWVNDHTKISDIKEKLDL